MHTWNDRAKKKKKTAKTTKPEPNAKTETAIARKICQETVTCFLQFFFSVQLFLLKIRPSVSVENKNRFPMTGAHIGPQSVLPLGYVNTRKSNPYFLPLFYNENRKQFLFV